MDQDTLYSILILAVFVVFTTALRILDFYLNLHKEKLLKQNQELQQDMTMNGLYVQISNKADETKSPLLLICYNKENNKMLYAMRGNENEFMKKLAENTQQFPEADEFMQIVATYYATNNQQPSTNN
jgi:hypothetical protein